MTTKKALAVGLYGAGKTSYLAALYSQLKAGRVPDGARLVGLPEDAAYLEEISQRQGSLTTPHHTSYENQQRCELSISFPGGSIVELIFPDLHGEGFLDFLQDREWDDEFDESVRTSDGLLVFVHSTESFPRHGLLDDRDEARAAAGGVVTDSPEPPKDWDARTMIPAQVQLVDLLQAVLRRSEEPDMRIALIVSAWDLLDSKYDTGFDWAEAEMPLLAQFLLSNKAAHDFRAYGLSAQGGTFGEDDQLLEHKKPWERPQLVGGSLGPNDVSSPLLWVLQMDGGGDK